MNKGITVTMSIEEYERLKNLDKESPTKAIFDEIGAFFGKAKSVIKNQERYIGNTDILNRVVEDMAVEVRKLREKYE